MADEKDSKQHSHHHHNHSRKRKNKLSRNAVAGIVLGSVAVVLLLIFLILRGNSYAMSLRFIGLDPSTVHVVEQNCYDLEGKEFKVIQANSTTGDIGLAMVSKNEFGFWSVVQYRLSNAGVQPDFTSMAWVQPGGVKTFDHGADSTFEQEWHYAYCGSNATELIFFREEQIPRNVTVNIQQAGATYWVHVISYADEAVIRDFDVQAALIENGCIPAVG